MATSTYDRRRTHKTQIPSGTVSHALTTLRASVPDLGFKHTRVPLCKSLLRASPQARGGCVPRRDLTRDA